jgi:5-oxopent-3-ene-1,2,5-tricarboxylate decarboxylase / 2-hydroxyhepta-2,4-diene-1,7-dioate isomerase
VQVGDVIVGDADGLLVIPPTIIDEVVAGAIEQERQEQFIAQMVASGVSVEGLYPLAGIWQERYAQWSTKK